MTDTFNKFMAYRNRHHNHKEGETLYYKCEHIKAYRPGRVVQVVPHYSMNYYILEVETGPPINEYFLKLLSEFNVLNEGEVNASTTKN